MDESAAAFIAGALERNLPRIQRRPFPIEKVNTTNQPIERFHPAVRRPGRCWAQIEFPALAPDDANKWLAEHDSSTRVDEPITLAELFAATESQLTGDEPDHQSA